MSLLPAVTACDHRLFLCTQLLENIIVLVDGFVLSLLALELQLNVIMRTEGGTRLRPWRKLCAFPELLPLFAS
jgi:hypothetical protein